MTEYLSSAPIVYLRTGVLIASIVWPLMFLALRHNPHYALSHAIAWSLAARFGWAYVLAGTMYNEMALRAMPYLALCFTSCSVVAVLGARRPLVGPWNFVVVGLLAVQLSPLAEGLFYARPLTVNAPMTILLAATLVAGVFNYLPTRLAPAALMLGLACAVELISLSGTESLRARCQSMLPVGRILLALAPWIAYLQLKQRPPVPSEFDRLWLDFRDRFGLVWAQRVRDQFNRSAANAGWPVCLRWQGLRILRGHSIPGTNEQAAIVAALQALLKRFGPSEKDRRPHAPREDASRGA